MNFSARTYGGLSASDPENDTSAAAIPGTSPDALAAVSAIALTKKYGSRETAVTALDAVSVGFERGKFTAIMGPSGSGKSTLMHCLAGLDSASSGSVYLGGTEITRLGDKQLTRLRRDRVGFVFQAFNLVPTLTAKQNMLLPLELASRKPDRAWMDQVVSILGLEPRLKHKPHELSGGQQQRVAVARALLSRPDVIFGDEPTGNLDSNSGAEVLGLLRRSVRELSQTVIMVTHDPVAASYADRVVMLADGRIAGDISSPSEDDVIEALRRLGRTDEEAVSR
ncbi:ABC transporter ATP-binding protein [Spelaeicoccus albus]|uniref:Putative ABC transport system ATP-binding protein n=1 Tax=Spelaeicoccus albus TaxID=1280376 RepID=A0A7Z0IHM9_9MICO|nr:ABC transporter ATP-binding protein [Spelaeicoccus albus]NYI67687.1 putative ABC transport system ATP-binding protein [Spelaeicoccus albus]